MPDYGGTIVTDKQVRVGSWVALAGPEAHLGYGRFQWAEPRAVLVAAMAIKTNGNGVTWLGGNSGTQVKGTVTDFLFAFQQNPLAQFFLAALVGLPPTRCACQRVRREPLCLMSAAGLFGWVKGAGLFGVAFVGWHGPAWIAKAYRRLGWTGALFGMLSLRSALVQHS